MHLTAEFGSDVVAEFRRLPRRRSERLKMQHDGDDLRISRAAPLDGELKPAFSIAD